jgi:hypothetical protein
MNTRSNGRSERGALGNRKAMRAMGWAMAVCLAPLFGCGGGGGPGAGLQAPALQAAPPALAAPAPLTAAPNFAAANPAPPLTAAPDTANGTAVARGANTGTTGNGTYDTLNVPGLAAFGNGANGSRSGNGPPVAEQTVVIPGSDSTTRPTR